MLGACLYGFCERVERAVVCVSCMALEILGGEILYHLVYIQLLTPCIHLTGFSSYLELHPPRIVGSLRP